jgi:hypothetical protein
MTDREHVRAELEAEQLRVEVEGRQAAAEEAWLAAEPGDGASLDEVRAWAAERPAASHVKRTPGDPDTRRGDAPPSPGVEDDWYRSYNINRKE